MKKWISLLLAGAALLAAVPAGAREFDRPEMDLPCRAAILIDQDTGSVLYEKRADEQMPIASITKVMTLLLTMEAVENGKIRLTDTVPISTHSYEMGGSQIWLEPGEEFTLDELLKALCVSSANDAAVAVAEYVGGSEPVFVEQMNARAAELGMSNTHFVNACGLDAPGHLSSARDVAVMSREILRRHPQITAYTTIWTDSLRNGATQLVNTNKLLRSYNGMTGLKTGTTSGAGVCVTASASRDGLSLIAVVLGAPSGKERWQAARTLLDYGFANFRAARPSLPAGCPDSLPVSGGEEEQVELEYKLPDTVLLHKGEQGTLTLETELPRQAQAPVAEGQRLGTACLMLDGQRLEECPITAARAVRALDYPLALRRLWKALAAA